MSRACRPRALVRVGLGLLEAALVVAAAVAGVGLVGGLFLLEALVVGAFAFTGGCWLRLRRAPGVVSFSPSTETEAISAPLATAAVVVITAVGLGLRLIGIGTDLWTDEIVTVRQFASHSPFSILHSYGAANNHLLNSLLVHASIDAFGYREWAIRLPALLAGALTVPATYALSRLIHSRVLSVVACACIAVAYQHIFFSQNARGYALMMLFAVLSTTALMRALRDDRPRDWLVVVAAGALCVAAVPTGGFVVTGQALVVSVAIVVAARSGTRWKGMAWHASLAFVAIGLLVLQVYAGILANASRVAQTAWQGDVGVKPLSGDFLHEVTRAAGIGTSAAVSVVAIAALLVGLLGLVSLARRAPAVLACLVLGPTLHLAYAIAYGLTFSPRFLVFWLFPAVLVAMETITVLQQRFAASGHRRAGEVILVVGGIGLCLALAAPSGRYLGKPKQRFREAILDAESRAGDGFVVGIETASNGLRYYGSEHPVGKPLREGEDFGVVRSIRQLTEIENSAGGRQVVLLTTLAPDLEGIPPRIATRIREGWREVASYSGTIPRGDITVWVRVAG